MSAVAKKDEGVRAFGPILAGLGDGAVHAEMSEKLQRLAVSVAKDIESGGTGKGKITLTISLKADRDGTIAVNSDVKIAEPKPALPRSLFWMTAQGALTPENPKQTKLALKDVSAAPAIVEPKAAVAGTKDV